VVDARGKVLGIVRPNWGRGLRCGHRAVAGECELRVENSLLLSFLES